jgi:hypothetical protein
MFGFTKAEVLSNRTAKGTCDFLKVNNSFSFNCHFLNFITALFKALFTCFVGDCQYFLASKNIRKNELYGIDVVAASFHVCWFCFDCHILWEIDF